MILTLDNLAATLGILGALLISFKKRNAFIFWIIGNALWVYLGFSYKSTGMIAQFGVFWLVAVFGWINWGKN
jgi:nicotinamide riboside transporter PnuC